MDIYHPHIHNVSTIMENKSCRYIDRPNSRGPTLERHLLVSRIKHMLHCHICFNSMIITNKGTHWLYMFLFHWIVLACRCFLLLCFCNTSQYVCNSLLGLLKLNFLSKMSQFQCIVEWKRSLMNRSSYIRNSPMNQI